MSQQPLISLCIANYNGMDVIDDCIQSIHQQTASPDIEIIVHDDKSTDTSVVHIQETYPDVHLIESETNVGFCVANNRMAAMARGEYLLLLNNDAALYPNALDTLYCAAQTFGLPAIIGLPQYDFDSGELLDIGSMLDLFLNPIPNKDSMQNDVGMVMGACLWIPKQLWLEIGGFPEWFGSIGEDLYLCCCARLAGYPVSVLSESGYRHKVGISFGGGKINEGKLSTTQLRRALSERNKTFVMLICYPWPLLLFLFVPHLLLLHIEGAVLSIIKLNPSLWRRIYAPLLASLWQEHHRIWSMRKVVQRQRKISLAAWLKPFRWLPWKLKMALKHGIPEIK